MVRANTLGATAIAAAITAGVASLEPANIGAADLWSNRKAVSEEQLDSMRGGFEAPNGLQLSFGIERAVFINGELVTATRLIVSNLPNLLSGGSAAAQVFANAFTVVQNGPGNSVENQPAPAPVSVPSTDPAATPSTAAAASATPANTAAAASAMPASTATAASATPASTATAASAAPASTATAASATPASTATAASAAPASTATAASAAPASTATAASAAAAGTAAAASATPASTATAAATTPPSTSASVGTAASTGLQSVQVNGQTLVLPSPTAIVTAVQNSVNNQLIQTRTSIDATMNSLSFLRSAAFADALRQQALLPAGR